MKLANGTYKRPHKRYTWWLRRGNYFQYMLRELSSLFIAITSLMLIWGVYQFHLGPEAYSLWLSNLWDNLLPFSVICFLFATYHSVTWFWVTPKAMPIRIAGKALTDKQIITAHLVAWLLVSLIVLLIFAGVFS